MQKKLEKIFSLDRWRDTCKLSFIFNKEEYFSEENFIEELEKIIELFLVAIKTKSVLEVKYESGVNQLKEILKENNSDTLNTLKKIINRYYDHSDFFKYEVIKETKKYYELEKICRMDFLGKELKDYNKKDNSAHYKYTIKIQKEYFEFNLNDIVYLIVNKKDNSINQFFREKNFLELKPILSDIAKLANIDTEKIENIHRFYINVISNKFINNFEENNKKNLKKIEDLKQKFFNIELPTIEDLFKSYEEAAKKVYNNEINSSTEIKAFNLEKRAEIFNEITFLNKIVKKSDDLKSEAHNILGKNLTLTENEKEMISLINKYYFFNNTINIDFKYEHRVELHKSVELELEDIMVK